ncbi:hypothetical protein ACFX2A_042931 [Malus domestica]
MDSSAWHHKLSHLDLFFREYEYFPLTIHQQLPNHLRAEAADALCYEAECRIQDSVCGCVKTIFQLHQEIYNAECQLAKTRAEIALTNSRGGGGHKNQVNQMQEVQSNLYFFPDQTHVEATQFGSSSNAPWFS